MSALALQDLACAAVAIGDSPLPALPILPWLVAVNRLRLMPCTSYHNFASEA